jgi:hypothetical protein
MSIYFVLNSLIIQVKNGEGIDDFKVYSNTSWKPETRSGSGKFRAFQMYHHVDLDKTIMKEERHKVHKNYDSRILL